MKKVLLVVVAACMTNAALMVFFYVFSLEASFFKKWLYFFDQN
jgi:hypothetical protein